MKKENLNNTMNCNCLQSILDYESDRHTVVESLYDFQSIEKSTDNGQIFFIYRIPYTRRVIRKDGRFTIDETHKFRDSDVIPIFFCPICGKKTKINVMEGDFYYKCQNNKLQASDA